jgi:AcrR family transcriptional regulator
MVYRRTERGDERYLKRRTQLIAAARALFTEQGYDETTMQNVVRKAGTSIGNCYFYFSNKEALLQVVIQDIISDIWTSADQALQNVPSGIKKLAFIFYQSITMMLENEATGRLMLMALSLPSVRNAVFLDYRKRVRHLIDDNPGLFVDEDVDFKINAAQGAAIALIEMILLDDMEYEPSKIGYFLARWNLQAIGLPQNAVEDALDNLKYIQELKKQSVAVK